MKRNNLYSGLVMPSSGWWSPIILYHSGGKSVKFMALLNFMLNKLTVFKDEFVKLFT